MVGGRQEQFRDVLGMITYWEEMEEGEEGEEGNKQEEQLLWQQWEKKKRNHLCHQRESKIKTITGNTCAANGQDKEIIRMQHRCHQREIKRDEKRKHHPLHLQPPQQYTLMYF